jgi:glycosyltransferase involved in cell wall biosynthesis
MKKKIAIITAVFPPYRGGIGTVAQQHAGLLSERAQDVTVFTPDYGQEKSDDDRVYKLERVKPVIKYGNAAWIPSLTSKLKDFDTVILEYPFFGGMRAVYDAKKKYGFKLVTYYHMDVVGGGLKGLLFKYATKFFLPKIAKASDVVLASSSDYATHSNLGKYWDSDNPKFKVLPIGVDTERFHPPDTQPNENMVLFVGALDNAHYFKGVGYLIKAFSHVEDRAKLVITGKGELIEHYKQLASEHRVRDRVTFAGGVSDEELVKLYQRASVTVLPSIDQSEAFGIVLVESMACGTPVIASNLPGVWSVFENGVSGFSIEPKDYKQLSEKITFVLNNSHERREMGKDARDRIQEKYSLEMVGVNLLKSV